MARDVFDDAADYLTHLIEEGTTQIEVPLAVAKALKVDGAPSRPVAESPAVSRSVSAPVPPSPAVSPPMKKVVEPARVRPPASKPVGSTPAAVPAEVPADIAAAMKLISEEISGCVRCGLCKKRTNTVPGQGNPNLPDIMFIGEAPGEEEDRQGLAFVGRAGQLLTRMILAMGYTREQIFIANICKCRPPDNRVPDDAEMNGCLPYLKRQIAVIKPKVIIALGATSLKGLLNLTGIIRLHGQWKDFEGIPLMPTFHPAYLLRNPPAKHDAWSDLKAVLVHLGRTPASSSTKPMA